MERTQIYLEPEQRKKLSKMAKQKGSTFSELVREAISSYLDRANHEAAPKELERIEDHPLWGLVGMIKDEGGETTYGSTTYKQALYGDKRGPWPVSS